MEKIDNIENKINLARTITDSKEKKSKEILEKVLKENEKKDNLEEKNKFELYQTLSENYYFL